MFLEQLPDNVRAVLAVSDGVDLSKLAQQADKIMELCRPSITAVSLADDRTRPASSAQGQIAELRSMIESLSNQIREDRSRNRFANFRGKRRRSSSCRRNNSRDGKCYYHAKFGSNARKCQQPCSWRSNTQQEN